MKGITTQDSALEARSTLVVEDDDIVLRLPGRMFTRRGCQVTTAVDGREASAMIETMDPPSPVLRDVMLPCIGG